MSFQSANLCHQQPTAKAIRLAADVAPVCQRDGRQSCGGPELWSDVRAGQSSFDWPKTDLSRLSASTPSAVQSRSPGRKWNEHGTAVAYLKNCQTDNGIPSPRGKSPTTHYSSSLRYDQFWPCNLVDQRNENKRILKIDACVRTAERVGISSPG